MIAIRFRRLRPKALYRHTTPGELSKPKRWDVRLVLVGMDRYGHHFRLISEFKTPYAIRLRDIEITISEIMAGMEGEAEEMGTVLDGGFMCVSERREKPAVKRR